jgi:hypothetical protein
MKSDEQKKQEQKLAALKDDAGRLKEDLLVLQKAHDEKAARLGSEHAEVKQSLAAVQDGFAELARAQMKQQDLTAKLAAASVSPQVAPKVFPTKVPLDAVKPTGVMTSDPMTSARPASPPRATTKQPATRAPGRSLEEGLARLDPAVPLVLLPVRIETRFDRAAYNLKVRIYPDEIFADGHEPELTVAERKAGHGFWELAQREGRAQDAWRGLILRFSPQRAAWIMRATAPGGVVPPEKSGAWTRAVRAWLLPDSWVVRVMRYGRNDGNGNPVTAYHRDVPSRAVDRPLALTLTPPDAAAGSSAGTVDPFDADASWAVNYARARDVGMAVDVPLTDTDLVRGFDRVYVAGVYSDQSPAEGARALARLFDAQHFTRGLGLVRQGTPTNNTTDKPAGFPPTEDERASFAVEFEPPSEATDGDGRKLARALGIDPAVFEHVEGYARTEQRNAADMNLALWPATLGYFLAQVLHPAVGPEAVWALREHFVEHVRGRGPLPALRIGNVPYGVVPVSSISLWQTRGDSELDKIVPPRLRHLRQRLRDGVLWVYNMPDVPHVGRTWNDPDRDLLEVLGIDASAREVRVRPALGPQTVANTLTLQGLDAATVARIRAMQNAAAAGLPAWPGRAARMVFDLNAGILTDPFVTPGVLSEEAPTGSETTRPSRYLDFIWRSTPGELQAGRADLGSNPPLLYTLVRHAALWEFVRVADECVADPSASLTASARRARAFHLDPEFIGIDPERETEETVWARLARAIPSGRSGTTVVENLAAINGTFLANLRFNLREGVTGDPVWPGLLEALRPYGAALEHLAGCPTAELERLLTETLDTVSHRVDAWETSLYTRRLDAMRSARPEGCHIGAYGWVENLQPRPPGYRASDGYVHAPSLDHAATAAVLLNAHRDRAGEGAERFRVDLSSARVRKAQEILDAVRNGQPLAAVLGYQVERALHDRRLDRYIAGLRRTFPMPEARPREPGGNPLEQVAARNVLNGLALRERCRAGAPPLDGVDDAHRDTVRRIYEDLCSSADAVGDLLTAESVFQIMRGNPGGAGASLEAMAQGQRPPDPEVVRSARGGVGVTHRVMLVLPAQIDGPKQWRYALTPRATLAPALDRWVGDLLGDPHEIRCRAIFGPDESPQTQDMSLAELDLRPLDVVAMAREQPPGFARGTRIEPSALATELERRLALRLPSYAERIRFDFWIEPGRTGGLKFPEAFEVARAVEDLLGGARSLRASDLVLPEAGPTENAPSITDAVRVAVQAVTADLNLVCETIRGATEDEELRSALLDATRFDLLLAMPDTPQESGDALRARGQRVVDEITRRLCRAAWPPGSDRRPSSSLDASELRGLAVAEAQGRVRAAAFEVVEAIFGRKRIVLPDFPAPTFREPVVPPVGAPAVVAPAQPARLAPSPREARAWMQKMWRVRAPLSRWRRVSLYGQALNGAVPRVGVAQLEPQLYGRWVASPAEYDRDRGMRGRPPSGCVSLYMVRPIERDGPWTGLLLDEWTEFIPNERELTGIGFHYDDPGAEAAQTILLAVPPVEDEAWTKETLFKVLDETFELAQVRALDAGHLREFAQVIPALCLGTNAAGDTVSASFAGRLVADAEHQETPS